MAKKSKNPFHTFLNKYPFVSAGTACFGEAAWDAAIDAAVLATSSHPELSATVAKLKSTQSEAEQNRRFKRLNRLMDAITAGRKRGKLYRMLNGG